MAELLIELFSEEIPARMQRQASADLARLMEEKLRTATLAYGGIRNFWTPRRLTLVIEDLPEKQPDLREEKKGPKVGAPERAIEGFLQSVGLTRLDQCEQRETPKGPVWFAVIERKGSPTGEVLPNLMADVIRALPWPKSMRFADQTFRWVRPLQGILAVFNGAVLEGNVDLGGMVQQFQNRTCGHRFLCPDSFEVTGFSDYSEKLKSAYVLLDPQERKQKILNDLTAAVEAEGLKIKEDPALLEEVTNLVEWPAVLIGRIDDAFMDVPPEALSTSMRAHQKYFSLLQSDGKLAARFAVIANMPARDGSEEIRGEKIRGGNERVLRARLADAKFFWDQDRATALESRLEALKKVIFHAKLGSVSDRVDRLTVLSQSLGSFITGCDPQQAQRAARLAKADLTTEMVGEFPELQGIMGRYYALDQNEEPAVAEAIAAHYSPAGPHDMCPTQPVSVAVALAEKFDTLVGFWLIDEKPTGSKDPFALRRAALGVIRLVLENQVRLSLDHVIKQSISLYEAQGQILIERENIPAIISHLISFFADRLRVHLKDEGISHNHIQALFALGDEDDLLRLVMRVHALRDFLNSDDGANLVTAYRRAANIVRAEENKDGCMYSGKPDAGLFSQRAEDILAETLETVAQTVKVAIEAEDYKTAMTALSSLRGSVDGFFEDVTVNTADMAVRKNRLFLLSRIRDVMGQLADFGQVES